MESRRTFVTRAAAVLGASSLSAASSEIVVGAIGCGGRMNRHLLPHLLISENVRVAAICDVYKPNLATAAGLIGKKVDEYGDYRRIIERKDINAVVVATPDHWHCPITIAACEAGKDVYVEKPLSNNIQDCLKAVEAARKYNRVVQVGLQQRSSLPFLEAYKVYQSGILGNIRHVVVINPGGASRRPATAGAPAQGGRAAMPAGSQTPPADLDWEMFQGPAPRRPYSSMRQNNWRNYWEYGAGTLSDWGVHLIDVAHWYLGVSAPPATAAAAFGWFSRPKDERTPDTVDVAWRYDKFVAGYSTRSEEQGTYFYGDQGTLFVNRSGYWVKPSGGNRSSQEAKNVPLHDEDQISKPSLSSDVGKHMTNWLDCIRSRQRPTVDIEIGAISTIPMLMGAMSILNDGKTIAWKGNGAQPLV